MHVIDLLTYISDAGLRIFKVQDFSELPLPKNTLLRQLKNLVQKGLIRKLFRGTYAVSNAILAGSPLHEYELVHPLISPSALCCWNALSFHGLTDQLIQKVFILAPYTKTKKNSSQYQYIIEGKEFRIIRVQPHFFFGIQQAFIGETSFNVTDLERTLIDGLVRPQYCGGFFEVMHAFEQAQERIDAQKIMHYAYLYGKSTSKRLGWVFEELSLFPHETQTLKDIPCTSACALDVSRPSQGLWIKDWNLRRNF